MITTPKLRSHFKAVAKASVNRRERLSHDQWLEICRVHAPSQSCMLLFSCIRISISSNIHQHDISHHSPDGRSSVRVLHGPMFWLGYT